MQYASGRCEFVDGDGNRCTERNPSKLEAHHIIGLRHGGQHDPRLNGRLLCRKHHRLIEKALKEGRSIGPIL